MKTKNKRKRLMHYVLALVVVTLIFFDFANSSNQYMEDGTFRPESEFDAVSSATALVSIVPSDYNGLSKKVSRSADPDFGHIQEMLDSAILLQGGFQGIIDKGDKVMVKVNLVGANSPSGQGENTDVRVVKALIKNIHEYAGGDVEIIIAEGTARTNDDPNTNGSVWENSGYKALLTDPYLTGINFRLLNLNQSLTDLIEIELESKGVSAIQGSSYSVHREIVEADVYIAVPVLKIHDTGITNALKLQIGTAPGCYYGYNKTAGTVKSAGIYHDVAQRRWTTEAIVDLCQVAGIDFVVVDAIMCLESYKTYNGDNQVRMNTILAGADPVAVDHVCTRMLGLNPDDIAHITLAEKVGLGTNDPDYIEIKGAALSDVKKVVKKNTAANGKFGQSNRTWILSNSFSASKVTDEGILDESTFVPAAGKNEWSQPVYFFDDRIDLSSYYKGAENINTYAFSYFYAPEAGEAELWLGSHEGIIVYINGEKVYSSSATNSYGDSDLGVKKAVFMMKKGENKLLVKTFNRFGDYSFALNICVKTTDDNMAGNRVEGLKFHTNADSDPVNIMSHNAGFNYDVKLYPNPCTTWAKISFNLPGASVCSIEIFDIQGKFINQLKKGTFPAGKNEIEWNLSDNKGQRVNTGTYICVVRSGKYQLSKQLIIQ